MNAILVKTLTASKNIDALNASFKYEQDLPNGSVFQLGALSTDDGESQVYEPVAPATGSLSGLWMAANPIDVIITDALGNQYKPGINNPGAYTNVANVVFSGFKPQVGDIIILSADGISGSISTNQYVVAANGATKLAFAAAAIEGLSFHIEETTYISVAGINGIGSERVTAYKLRCVAN